MWHVDCFPFSEQYISHRGGSRGVEQHFQHCGSVSDNHRRLRSSRRISTGEILYFTGVLLVSRSAISLMVGRSASCSISLNSRSESETPLSAARDLSLRCSASGTLRI